MKKSLAWVIIIICIVLAACSNDKESVHDSPESTYDGESKEPENMGGEGSNHIHPFTGMETDKEVNQRMIGVMVNNHPKARPQTGLSKADIVFEILAEGQITRFLALFQSELPEEVGPVRSAREYYFELAEGYDALYVYHGAANFVNDMIQNRAIEHINGSKYDNDGHLFKRASFRKAPHNSYLQMNAVNEVASGKGYDTTFDYVTLPFVSDEDAQAMESEAATNIDIVYSERLNKRVSFHYDADAGRYMRSSDGEKTVELHVEEPVAADNVFVVETRHEVIDDAGRRAVDLDSGGEAYLLQKGNVQEVKWKNEDGRIIPIKDGKTVPFVPGNTWVNVVPVDPGMENIVTISGNAG